jgi:hypothetical protein
MKTPIAAVKSSGAEPPAAMKVAPATSSLIPPVTKRGYFTLKQKNTLAAMMVAPATSSLIPPAKMRLLPEQKNHWQLIPPAKMRLFYTGAKKYTGSQEGCACYVFANSACKKRLFHSEVKENIGNHEGCTSYVLAYFTCKKVYFTPKQKTLATMKVVSAVLHS